jgi:hypothetical protein
MNTENKNDLLVSKDVTAVQKGDISVNTKKIFYVVLKEKIKEFMQDDFAFNSDGQLDWNDILINDIISKPMIFTYGMLRKVFGHKNFEYIRECVDKIKFEVHFKTYNSKGAILHKTPLFKDIAFPKYVNEIHFLLNDFMVKHLCNLQKFAKIDITELILLRTDNQIRMYEYICEFNYLDDKGNKLMIDEKRKMKIEKFLEYFGIQDKYISYINENNKPVYLTYEIERKIIIPALNGINKYTRYNAKLVKFKLDRYSRNKVTHFRIDTELKPEYKKVK